MSMLFLWLIGCNLTKPDLTLDTADTAIVWEEPTSAQNQRRRSLREALEPVRVRKGAR